ncbi:transcriptional repressor general negative regulator of transcription subunit 4 [Podochytrium sp. JEL0797]|nr:transcriptional repressor general negative regulator of transcription subunit 4 [Podochytrium sp. JEL0797]
MNDYDSDSSNEDMECPLCMEEIDLGDKYFKPCPCGYQICRFCWNHIKEDLNGLCPACRRQYTEEQIEFTPVSADELFRIKEAKKRRERERKEMDNAARRHLANARVVQKNLVYVVGLPAKFATEEHLKSNDFFGQFGKVARVVINRKGHGHTPVVASLSALGVFVFYSKKEDAIRAIDAVDGTVFDGNKVLRVTHGTTKYCQFFLKNLPCQHSVCQYLHEPAEEADTYAKEELSRQAIRDRNPRPVPFPTLMAYFRKDEKEESALPATASWAKPIGTRSTASPIPHALQHRITPQPSESDLSDSDIPRPLQNTNLMDLIVEKKKKVKKSATGTPVTNSSEIFTPQPPTVSQPQPPDAPPGLSQTRSQISLSANGTVSVSKPTPAAAIPTNPSSTSLPTPATVPDEELVLGSKALNQDGTDEIVPTSIRRGPTTTPYAIARTAAIGSGRKKASQKGGVSLYNMGYILRPTYTGLFDPFSSDPMALIRGMMGGEGEFGGGGGVGRFGRMMGEEEEKGGLDRPRNMYSNNVLPQPGVQDVESRWMEGGKMPDFPASSAPGSGGQWPQQPTQQQLLREQILAENALRQQQQLRAGAGTGNQFGGGVSTLTARQQQELLLQQQQQQRFQQQQQLQQQQYLGGVGGNNAQQDEFMVSYMREAQLRENQVQMRDLQMRERAAALVGGGAGAGMKGEFGGWGAAGGYAQDSSLLRDLHGANTTPPSTTQMDPQMQHLAHMQQRELQREREIAAQRDNREWMQMQAMQQQQSMGGMGSPSSRMQAAAAAAAGRRRAFPQSGGALRGVGGSGGGGMGGGGAVKGNSTRVIEEDRRSNASSSVSKSSKAVETPHTVVGAPPKKSKPDKKPNAVFVIEEPEFKPSVPKPPPPPPAAVAVPVVSKKEKAKQRAKEKEMVRQLQRERDLQKENERKEKVRLEAVEAARKVEEERVRVEAVQVAAEAAAVAAAAKAARKQKHVNVEDEQSVGSREGAVGCGKSKKSKQRAKKKMMEAAQAAVEVPVEVVAPVAAPRSMVDRLRMEAMVERFRVKAEASRVALEQFDATPSAPSLSNEPPPLRPRFQEPPPVDNPALRPKFVFPSAAAQAISKAAQDDQALLAASQALHDAADSALKSSRRKRAKERDELAAKQQASSSVPKAVSGPLPSSSSQQAPLALPPMFMEFLGKAASSSNAPNNMAGLSAQLSNFATALNGLPSDLTADMNSLASGPLGELTKQMLSQISSPAGLAGMANMAHMMNAATGSGVVVDPVDVSFDCEVTPEGLTKAMLSIAETFLASAESCPGGVGGVGVSVGMGVGIAASSGGVPVSDFQFQRDLNTGVFTAVLSNGVVVPPQPVVSPARVGGDKRSVVFGPELPPGFQRQEPSSSSSSKYINPFPMVHPNNAAPLEVDSEFDESIYDEEEEGTGYYDDSESDNDLEYIDNSDDYEDVDEPDGGIENPDRALTFLNQGSSYISELLDSVRWMVSKGEALINSPTYVSPEVTQLLCTLDAERETPRDVPCRELIEMLERERERCQAELKLADRELVRVMDVNRKNAGEFVKRFGFDSGVIEGICVYPVGVRVFDGGVGGGV